MNSALKEADLTGRLDKARVRGMKREAGAAWRGLVARAIAEARGDSGLGAVRLLQLCGIRPTDAEAAALVPEPATPAETEPAA